MTPERPRGAIIAALADRLSRIEASPGPGPGTDPGYGGNGAPAVPLGLGDIDRRFAAGGLPAAGVHELWSGAPGHHPAAAGFALALYSRLAGGRRGMPCGGDLVWVYMRGEAHERGLVYGPGLMAFGHDPGRLVLVEARRPLEALWAGEEALRASPAADVVIALDAAYARHAFMASRRLELAARATGASAFLLCVGDEAPVTAASLRWRVGPMPGVAPHAGIGLPAPFPARPRWRVVLERNRLGRCGAWDIEWNHESGMFETPGADAGAVAGALVGRAGADKDAHALRRTA